MLDSALLKATDAAACETASVSALNSGGGGLGGNLLSSVSPSLWTIGGTAAASYAIGRYSSGKKHEILGTKNNDLPSAQTFRTIAGGLALEAIASPLLNAVKGAYLGWDIANNISATRENILAKVVAAGTGAATGFAVGTFVPGATFLANAVGYTAKDYMQDYGEARRNGVSDIQRGTIFGVRNIFKLGSFMSDFDRHANCWRNETERTAVVNNTNRALAILHTDNPENEEKRKLIFQALQRYLPVSYENISEVPRTVEAVLQESTKAIVKKREELNKKEDPLSLQEVEKLPTVEAIMQGLNAFSRHVEAPAMITEREISEHLSGTNNWKTLTGSQSLRRAILKNSDIKKFLQNTPSIPMNEKFDIWRLVKRSEKCNNNIDELLKIIRSHISSYKEMLQVYGFDDAEKNTIKNSNLEEILRRMATATKATVAGRHRNNNGLGNRVSNWWNGKTDTQILREVYTTNPALLYNELSGDDSFPMSDEKKLFWESMRTPTDTELKTKFSTTADQLLDKLTLAHQNEFWDEIQPSTNEKMQTEFESMEVMDYFDKLSNPTGVMVAIQSNNEALLRNIVIEEESSSISFRNNIAGQNFSGLSEKLKTLYHPSQIGNAQEETRMGMVDWLKKAIPIGFAVKETFDQILPFLPASIRNKFRRNT